MTSPAAATRDETSAAARGRLTITDRAVETIAVAVLGEIDLIGGGSRRRSGDLGGGRSRGPAAPQAPPRVRATVHGSATTLQVRCSVAYPAPIARTADLARAHLVARIDELTGLAAAQVDITVTALTGPDQGRAR